MTIIFVIFFLLSFALLNFYVGNKIFIGISLFKNINKKVFWFIYILFPLCFSLYMLLGGIAPKLISLMLYYPGTYYLGAFLYLLIIFVILDLVKILLKKFTNTSIYNSKILYIFITIFIVFILGYGSFNAKSSYVKEYSITLDKPLKQSTLNLVLVSDIHLSNVISTNKLSKMVDEINVLNPDIVLIAGDLIDMSIKPFIDNNMANILGNINTKYGTYFALGNHDIYAGKDADLSSILESEGITVLRDEVTLIADSFYIVGRDDKAIERFGINRKSISELTSNLDKSKPIFLIDHTPDNIDDSISNEISLQVSGHTHRGQMYPGNLLTSMIFPLDYGYENIDGLNLVVSSGYGYWGPPLRIGSRSEIVNLKIKS